MPTTSAGSTAAPYQAPTVDPSSFVYHIDIFLLVVILVFALFNAPRAIVRFSRRSEWLQGHLLRSSKLARTSRMNLNTNSICLHSDPLKAALDLDGGSTETMHSPNAPYFASQSTHVEKALPPRPTTVVTSVSMQQTLHLPMLSSLVYPISSLLHMRVHECYSLGQVLLLAAYSIVILYAGLYQSNPFVDFDRSGWVCTSQLPFIYALSTKNNVIGMLVGVGYEKLNYLHRFAGRFAILAANVHVIGNLYEWSIAGDLSKYMSQPSIIWGFVALVCFDMMGIFSLQFVRSRFYNLFLATHVVGLIMLLISISFHHPSCVPYIIVACVFYGLDHLVRGIKTRITTATLRPIPELGVTRIEMPFINAGWRAGQHVRLRVLSTAMGPWRMIEVHPFTIANVSKTEEGLVLLCKKAGGWTSRMYEIANTHAYGEHGKEVSKRVRVMVEGPYGGVGSTVISSYSGALFVVGGSGVTFALSAVQELVRAGTSSNVTDMEVVWCVADPASLAPMVPLFAALVSQSTAARVRFSVFYTRAPTRSLDGMYLPPGITLRAGRPNVLRHLDGVVRAMLRSGGGSSSSDGHPSQCQCSGVFVGVCGPSSLAGSVGEIVRRFDPVVKRAVGGVELHEEVFGW